MENVANESVVLAAGIENVNDEKNCDDAGAVDIVDFYATKSDARKQSECSDSMTPTPPSRRFSSIDSAAAPPSPRKSSECEIQNESPPMKPSRRVSQCSNNNRKFSVCSNISVNRAPKKVSFSDEWPFSGLLNLGDTPNTESEQSIQLTSDYLETIRNAIDKNSAVVGSVSTSSDDGSASTTPVNELSAIGLFPNGRKMSIHSVRSMDVGPSPVFKPSSDSSKPFDTLIDQERRSSSASQRSN